MTPGSGTEVGVATVRGVKSFGMLCSAHDLGWAAQANGLAVQLPPGMPAGQSLGDAPPKVQLPLMSVGYLGGEVHLYSCLWPRSQWLPGFLDRREK